MVKKIICSLTSLILSRYRNYKVSVRKFLKLWMFIAGDYFSRAVVSGSVIEH